MTRTELDGSVTVIADRFDGKRLNSPNDVVVSSDGAVWFTDPTYGIDGDYEGNRAVSEIGASNVYRVDPASGAVEIAADDFVKPNGLAFSPDEQFLYIVDTGATHVEDGRATSASSDTRRASCPAARSLPSAITASTTVSGSMWTAISGPVRVMACIASIRRGS